MNEPSQKIIKRTAFLAAGVFLAGLLVTAWGFNALYQYSEEKLTAEIKRRYETKASQLQERIDLGLESLRSIAALYKANDEVSFRNFKSFVFADAASHEGTTALGWVPRVTREERDRFTEQAKREVSPDFRIFEVSGHGMPTTAFTHDFYFPVYYLVSLSNEKFKLGMNLTTIPAKWRAMKTAIERNSIAVTSRIVLYQKDGQYGFQAFLPIPIKGKKIYKDISTVSGFALGQFDISTLLKSVFTEEEELEITLLDTSAGKFEQLLYFFSSVPDQEPTVHNMDDLDKLKEPYWTRQFTIGDRQWMAIFRSPKSVGRSVETMLPYIGVLGGILITSLLSLYLFLAQIRGTRLFLAQKEVEQERALKTEAVEENLSKSRFLRAASHDLRQPLNTLSLYTHLLEGKAGQDSEVGELVEKIRRSVDSLNNMFNALLDLGRLEAGQLKPSIVNFRIEGFLEKLEDEFSTVAEAKNLEFHVVRATGVITSDPDLLERIVRNFLTNAIRYTDEGKILLGCRRKGDELRIQVSDTGAGLNKEAEENIFKEFYRGASSHIADQGLGLGLSIVAFTARLLGHHFGVYSSEGKGSTFYIDVPFEEE